MSNSGFRYTHFVCILISGNGDAAFVRYFGAVRMLEVCTTLCGRGGCPFKCTDSLCQQSTSDLRRVPSCASVRQLEWHFPEAGAACPSVRGDSAHVLRLLVVRFFFSWPCDPGGVHIQLKNPGGRMNSANRTN